MRKRISICLLFILSAALCLGFLRYESFAQTQSITASAMIKESSKLVQNADIGHSAQIDHSSGIFSYQMLYGSAVEGARPFTVSTDKSYNNDLRSVEVYTSTYNSALLMWGTDSSALIRVNPGFSVIFKITMAQNAAVSITHGATDIKSADLSAMFGTTYQYTDGELITLKRSDVYSGGRVEANELGGTYHLAAGDVLFFEYGTTAAAVRQINSSTVTAPTALFPSFAFNTEGYDESQRQLPPSETTENLLDMIKKTYAVSGAKITNPRYEYQVMYYDGVSDSYHAFEKMQNNALQTNSNNASGYSSVYAGGANNQVRTDPDKNLEFAIVINLFKDSKFSIEHAASTNATNGTFYRRIYMVGKDGSERLLLDEKSFTKNVAEGEVGGTYHFKAGDRVMIHFRGSSNGAYLYLMPDLVFDRDGFDESLRFDYEGYLFGERNTALEATFDNGKLKVKVKDAISSYQYQYWIKALIDTDGESNLNAARPVWQLVAPFSPDTQAVINVGLDGRYLIDGCYEVLIRVKGPSGEFVKDIYASFASEDIGQVKINTVTVNGSFAQSLFVIDKSAPVKVRAAASVSEGVTYTVKIGGLEFDGNGEFALDLSGLKDGYYDLEVTAENSVSSDTVVLKAYLFTGDFKADEVAVIKSLKGTSGADGYTQFVMELTYADGTNIPASEMDGYYITLKSESSPLRLESLANNEDGVLEAVFIADYNYRHGIYMLYGTIGRAGLGGADDFIIHYYDGYARKSARLEHTASTYEAEVGTPITITASGNIEGRSVKYAFYKEDAGGWALIRGYAESGVLVWKPLKAGVYNIQVRVKADDAGAYEKAVTRTYTITDGSDLSGSLGLKVYDLVTGAEAATFAAGMPYKIVADFGGDNGENVLYRFTVYNVNQGLNYINEFTANGSVLFIPNKYDTFIITVRVIRVNSYGYMEISKSVTVDASMVS